MRQRVCRVLIIVYILLYLIALAVAIVGTRGLFGVQPDGLMAVYLLFLGMPWTLVLPVLPLGSMPELLGQLIVAGLPILNLICLVWFCRRKRKRTYY